MSLSRAAAVVVMVVVVRPPVSRRVERLLQLGHALFDGSGAGPRRPGNHPLGKLLSLAVGQSLEQFVDSLTHGSIPKSLTEWIKRRCVVSRKPGPKVPSAGGRASPSLRRPSTLVCYTCRPSAGSVGESGDAAGGVREAEVSANISDAEWRARCRKTVTAGATVRKSPIAL